MPTAKPTKRPLPVLLRVEEVAEMLGCCRAQAFVFDKRCAIPSPIRIGKFLRRSIVELEEWIAAGGPTREAWNSMKNGPQDAASRSTGGAP